MPREAEPSVNEKEFILKALHEGVRLDGRPFDQYRNIDISFGDEYGVVDVSLGKTRYNDVHATLLGIPSPGQEHDATNLLVNVNGLGP
ncbi:Exosome complex component rrp45 like protein [Verticillium longisporum]|nr:Exosome complex component rrp45 like protein [Verticillium longisporum]